LKTPGNHAAFGKVTQGLDLLDKILEADTFKSVRACK
jgi:cyclophilin family peptidyl-prolyl cis-trans isomerase